MATQLMKDWIVELYNPDRKQATGGLGYIHEDGTQSNCCLGVLCEVGGIRPDIDDERTDGPITLSYNGFTGLAPMSVIDQVLGKEPDLTFSRFSETIHLYDDDDGDPVSADAANDEQGLTFKEIARHLEDKYLTAEEVFEVRKRVEDNGWA